MSYDFKKLTKRQRHILAVSSVVGNIGIAVLAYFYFGKSASKESIDLLIFGSSLLTVWVIVRGLHIFKKPPFKVFQNQNEE